MIAAISTLLLLVFSEYTMAQLPGSCSDYGITCCTPVSCPQQMSPDNCYCDISCYSFNDCCQDIDQICGSGCTNETLRLSGGNNLLEGRVEFCQNNVWGTICDEMWSAADARVVCNQLGHPNSGAQAFGGAQFGLGTGPIQITAVNCTGKESSIMDCQYTVPGTDSTCSHQNDAGVECGYAQCIDGEVRLQDGISPYEGRVEVCLQGVWGTVCDNSWGVSEATVVCSQLGYPTNRVTALSSAYFGAGNGSINMNNLLCIGNESSLFNCSYDSSNANSMCTHNQDSSVICGLSIGCQDGDLRLVNGLNYTEGRVEVCFNEVWGTICDDLWGIPDAVVVCRQLGLSTSGVEALDQAYFGQGTGSIFMDNVNCAGHENTLISCPYIGDHNCGHSEDAAVRCGTFPAMCTDYDIRLAGGSNNLQGRVEVCRFGQWGTVCDDFWGAPDAQVVCRQLGLPSGGAQALKYAYYGQGSGPIFLDDVQCTGDESSIFNCSSTINHNCGHAEDASVVCANATCTDGDISLLGGSSELEGRVEVCVSGVWGTVCDDSWDGPDAQVACRQLNLPYTGATAYGSAYFGQGTGSIVMDDLGCIGNESSLLNCPFNPNHNCFHFEDAGVVCGNASCTENNVRLVNGFTDYEGRVEVCLNGKWGTVCDDFWSTNDAMVVCGQLGYPVTGAVSIGSAYFGPGAGPINMDDVICDGTESMLTSCSYSSTHNCAHSEDASVICASTTMNCTDGEVMLVGGQNVSEGRVEICINNQWGTVCDDLWSAADAKVVCQQLGYFGGAALGSATYGQGQGPIFLDNVECNGSETNLLACSYSPIHNCVHAEDAGVRCFTGNPECTDGNIQLIGGTNISGRVEVCLYGGWGTVCDDSWTYMDAQVVCNQLRLPSAGAQAVSLAQFGIGSGPILLDDVQCVGNESFLVNCTYNPNHNCFHFEDAGVICSDASCNEGDIRLMGGANGMEGRVEICLGGQWGTICDDIWGKSDARVVCKQLGLNYTGAVAYSNAYYGVGTGPIVLDNLDCDGSEAILLDCPYDPDTSDCSHFEDAGVMCGASPNECSDGEIQLMGGTTVTEGRVEVCYYGQWGTVCDDFWGVPDARVVCNQLGFPTGGVQALKQAYFGQGTGQINIDDVGCIGNESFLLNCSFNPDHNCAHSEDAGVVCGEAQCTDGDIRLFGGSSSTEGTVEICYNSVWGTVCDDFWGDVDAQVVCTQLGYPAAGALAFSQSYFGPGTGPINLDDVQCSGSEGSLLSCSFNPDHNCFHTEDAGVICNNGTQPVGPCALKNFTGCCNISTEPNCFGITGNCYCDALCYEFADCCSDVADIGCLSLVPSPTLDQGSCAVLGYNGCCSKGPCTGSDGICYCDLICYLFGDCCSDIQEINCYSTGSSPTPTGQVAPSTVVPTSSMIVLPTPSPMQGSCVAAGFMGCCNPSTAPNCLGSPATCYCDELCFSFGDCCFDIELVGCIDLSSPPISHGTCLAAGYTTCCNTSAGVDCTGSDGFCRCSADCFSFGDCCTDIDDLGCITPTVTPIMGSCLDANYTDCCHPVTHNVSICLGQPTTCFCDAVCYSFGDCCDDVDQIGCMEPSVIPPFPDGTCAAAGYTSGCCVPSDSNDCLGYPENCYCDQICHNLGDCCSDINDINCGFAIGSCKEAGYDSCCVGMDGSCLGSPANCYCDMLCAQLGDCCDDISLLSGCGITSFVSVTRTLSISTSISTSSFTATNSPSPSSSLITSNVPSPTPGQVPGPVRSIMVDQGDLDDTATITWVSPEIPASLSKYVVAVQTLNGQIVQNFTVQAGGALSQTVDKLQPYVPYIVVVYAVNINGNGVPTMQLFFSAESTPSKPPENVKVLRVNETTINVTWTLMSLTEARGNITGYDVVYEVATSGRKRQDMIVMATPNKGYAVIENLAKGTQYAAKVRAVTTAGNGPYSSLAYEETIDTETSFNIGGIVVLILVMILIVVVAIIALVLAVMYLFRKSRKMKSFSTRVGYHTEEETLTMELTKHDFSEKELSTESPAFASSDNLTQQGTEGNFQQLKTDN